MKLTTFLLLAAVLWPWTVKGQDIVGMSVDGDTVVVRSHTVDFTRYAKVKDSTAAFSGGPCGDCLTRSDVQRMIDSAIAAQWEMRVDTTMYTSGFCDTGYVFYAVPETTWVFVRPKEGKP